MFLRWCVLLQSVIVALWGCYARFKSNYGKYCWLITMYTVDRCHVPSCFYTRVIDLCFDGNYMETTLQRCHMSVVSLFSILFSLISKKTHHPLLALCEGNPLVTGGFPSQRANYVENVSISWCHHDTVQYSAAVTYFMDTDYNMRTCSNHSKLWITNHLLHYYIGWQPFVTYE